MFANYLCQKFYHLNSGGGKLEKFSSGQKMRIRFLCELLYDPEFIIIDEAFSSLDRKTLIKCIDAIKPTTSILVIDHSNDLDTLIKDFIHRLIWIFFFYLFLFKKDFCTFLQEENHLHHLYQLFHQVLILLYQSTLD